MQVLASPCLASPMQQQQSRHLSIHEHQAMDLLKTCGILVPQYKVATTAEEAGQIAKDFGMLFHMYTCMFALLLVPVTCKLKIILRRPSALLRYRF